MLPDCTRKYGNGVTKFVKKSDLAEDVGRLVRETFLFQRIRHGYSQFNATKYLKEVIIFVKIVDLAKELGNFSGKHFCTNAYAIDTLNLETEKTPKGLLNSSKHGLAKEFAKFVRGTFLHQAICHMYPVLT